MMQDRYSLTRGQSRFCRVAAVLLWVAAGIAALMLPVFWFGIGGMSLLQCTAEAGCTLTVDRTDMLPDEVLEIVRGSPAAAARFEAFVRRPDIRALLTLLVTVRILLYVAMFACAAIALWRFGTKQGIGLATAFPWLKRAALMATGVAVLPPFIDSLRGMIVATGVVGSEPLHIEFAPDLEMVGLNMMLALTMLSVAWALEAGTRAARDMDGFV